MNKTLKYLFGQLFNNGNLIKLVIPYKQIKKLDDFYKNHFLVYSDLETFKTNESKFWKEVSISKSAEKEVIKQFNSKKGLQPCILTECFVSQTIANLLELNEFADIDANDHVPAKVTGTIYSMQGYTDGSKFRYCYYNNKFDTLLLQCGASGTVDLVFTKYNLNIRIEVKEQVARLEECDIKGGYNEEGKLIITDEFKKNRANYVPYLEAFNQVSNIFELEGHNFKITDYLQNDKVRNLIKATLESKVIDLFILVVKDYMVPVLSNYLMDFISFENSEIRTAGKNDYSLFTPNFAIKKIQEMGGVIENNVVILPYETKNLIKARGKTSYSRYGIGSLLSVKLDKTTIVENKIKFNFNDIKQKKPCISIHLNANINNGSLRTQYIELKKYN